MFKRLLILIFLKYSVFDQGWAEVPVEPVDIGFETQYFVDDFIVDNRWGNKQGKEMILREFHQPVKYEANPVLAGQGGYVCVDRDEDSGEFKMWYQTWYSSTKAGDEKPVSVYGIAYAESKDGMNWELPNVGQYDWNGTKENNIVWKGLSGKRASGQQILSLPEKAKRGYKYVMTYRSGGGNPKDSGIRVVGSQDGIHWDKESDTFLHLVHSDTNNGIVYDSKRGEFVMFCRAKDRYRVSGSNGEMIDLGASRRIARMSHKNLWEEWPTQPQSILNPDALDAADNFNAFYGMPAKYHAGIYWGALWVFRFNDNIYTELVTSRDGFQLDRAPVRKPLFPLGKEGSWDSYMIFASPDWVEVGDEWWVFYSGWDGPHGSRKRTPGIGLAKIRKGGFVSLRGPKNGGGVVTRQLVWPGGDLHVNANASGGELKVRISGNKRKALEGFDYSDGPTITSDSLDHNIRWGERSLDDVKGQTIRIEFSLRKVDLFSFEASKNK